MGLDFTIAEADTIAASPIADVTVRMPSSVRFYTSTLGEAICLSSDLLREGLSGCSPNARIGVGTARVAVPVGSRTLTETVAITTLTGGTVDGHVEILYYATGDTPVIAKLLFRGGLGTSEFGEYFSTSVPATPILPGGPNATLLSFHTSIGPRGLYYYEYFHGRHVRFRPRGIVLPPSCPRTGFPFSATFSFQDGSTVTAKHTVPCPVGKRGRKGS